MNVELFLQRIKEINSKMENTFSDYFLEAIITINDNTRNTFFKHWNTSKKMMYSYDSRDSLTDFSCKLICFSVSDITTNEINKMIKTNNCSHSNITEWFQNNGNICCKRFLTDYVFRDCDKPLPILLDEIYGQIKSSRFARAFLEGETIAPQNIHAMALMSVLEIIFSNSKFNELKNHLENDVNVGIAFQNYNDFNWSTALPEIFIKGGTKLNEIKNCVLPAVNDAQTRTWTETVDFGRGHIGIRTKSETTYAKPMKDWLSTTGINYYEKSGNSDESGCVLGGTLILMADGSLKKIEEMVQGDEVFSIGGYVSVISNEKIMNTQVKKLYSIGDDDPFMSLEHPILCQDGFKSLNPQLSNEIAPDLNVTLLKEGDLINKSIINKDGKLEYYQEVVDKINISENPGFVCYDLHFSSGYASYHANGYCCGLIYPQITTSYIKNKVEKFFSDEEKEKLLTKIKNNDNEYIKLFGKEILDSVLKTMEQSNRLNAASYLNFNKDESLHLRFTKIKYSDSNVLSNLTYIDNTIIFDGICSHAYQEDNMIYFCYKNKYPAAIQLLHNGLLARGIIQEGNTYRHFVAIFEDEYDLIKDNKVIAKMVITQKEEANEYVPVAYLKDCEGLVLDGFTLAVSHKKTKEGYSTLCIDISSSIFVDNAIKHLDMDIPQSIHFIFDVMATKAIEDTRIDKGNGIRAVLIDDKSNLWHTLSYDFQQQRPPRAHDLYLNPKGRVFDNEIQKRLKMKIPLSVERLYSLAMPENLMLVHQNSFAKLYTMMYYVAEDDWLSLIGKVKPTVTGGDLSAAEKELADEYYDFLKNNLAKAIISNSVGIMDDKDVKKEVKEILGFFDKLDYFLEGDDHEICMQNNKDFQSLMRKLNANSYLSFVTELNEFINDDKEKWASRLYHYCSRDEILINIALKTPTCMEMDPFRKHISTMLDLLDDSKKNLFKSRKNLQVDQTTYAVKFQQNLMNCQLGDMAGLLKKLPEEINADNLNSALLEVAKQLYNAVMDDQKFYGQTLDKETIENLKNEIISKDIDKYIAEVSLIITGITDALVAGNERWLDFLLKNNLKCVASLMCSIGLLSVCGLIFNGGKVDWSKPSEAINFITSIVQTVASTVDVVSTIAVGKVFKQTTFTAEELLNATSRITHSGYYYLDWGDGGGELFNHDGLLKAFKIIETVAKVINILGLVVSNVLLFMDMLQEKKTWKLVMNSIEIIDMLILTGLGIAELFSISIPIVGEVCIVISLLVAIISLIIEALEDTPAVAFIKNVSKPFITPLPMPSDEYLKHKNEMNLYLKKLNLVV